MNNKSKKGLRPFQPVVYITEAIYDQLDWKGYDLSDLFSFSKVITSLSDEDILTFLSLNSSDPNKNIALQYPFAIGVDVIFREWNQELTNSSDESLLLDLKRIRDSVKVNSHHSMALTTLSMDLDEPTNDSQGYFIVHDENMIHVVLKKNDKNLLDFRSMDKIINIMSRDIVKVYNLYFDYASISSTPWFRLYIEKL